MKKSTILKSTLLSAGILAMSVTAISFSAGAPEKKNGSPGSNGTNCGTSCHTGGTASGETVTITTDIPASGFSENTTYTITVTLNDGGTGASKAGFQTSFEYVDMGTSFYQGNQIVTNSSETKLTGTGNHFMTHNGAGSFSGGTKVFTFEWNSGTAEDGTTIYAVGNFANGNGMATGDVIVEASLMLNKNSIGLEENAIDNLTVYPNPAKDVLNVDYSLALSSEVEIQLYDLSGRMVSNLFSGHEGVVNQHTFDVSEIPSGTYILMINADGQIKHEKLIIQ